MNVLDENILKGQRQRIQSWRIPVRQIGYDIGRGGMKDDEIIPFLHRQRRVAFFTRDLGFYDRRLRHRQYCLVCMALDKHEVAIFTRLLLRHPEFDTEAKRLGSVVRISHMRVSVWRPHAQNELHFDWE